MGEVFAMEADRLAHLQIEEDKAKPELAVVLNERDERTDNRPEGRFAEEMAAALFPGSAYGRPVIGARADVAGLSVADANAFYRAHYVPSNAVLIVSGNVTAQEALRLAAGTFGRSPAGKAPRRKPVVDPSNVGAGRVEVADPRVRQARLVWQIRAPNFREAPKTSLALDVLGELLAGGQSGVLYDELVRKQALASGLDADYDGLVRGPASFGLYLTPRAGVAPGAAEAALKEALRRRARRGFSEAAVRRAVLRLERETKLARDSLNAPGNALGAALCAGYEIADVEAWPARIRALRAADVNAALRRLVAEKRQVIGLLRPEGENAGNEEEPAPLPERDVR
jgi:zinc protease